MVSAVAGAAMSRIKGSQQATIRRGLMSMCDPSNFPTRPAISLPRDAVAPAPREVKLTPSYAANSDGMVDLAIPHHQAADAAADGPGAAGSNQWNTGEKREGAGERG